MGNLPQASTTKNVIWDSTTPANSALQTLAVGYQSALVTVNSAGIINAGGIVFEGYDGYQWYGLRATERYTGASDQSYGLANGPAAITCEISGFSQFRVRLLTPINGSGAVSISVAQSTVSSPNSINQAATNPGPSAAVNLNQVGGANYALGQTTMSASMPVVIASDQSPLTEIRSGAILANQTNGTQKTQIVDPTGANLGTLANPIYTMLGKRTLSDSLFTQDLTDYITAVFGSTAQLNAFTYDNSANGGSTGVDASSNLVVQSGTATNGYGSRISKGEIIYAPGHEFGFLMTTLFTASTPGAKQRAGLITPTNGFYLEDDGTQMTLVHLRGGSIAATIPQSQWTGNFTTKYLANGSNTIDWTTGRVLKVRGLYLGYGGFVVEIMSPDTKEWVTLHTISYQNQTAPLFTQTNLTMRAEVQKTSGASNVTVKSASWEGYTMGSREATIIAAEGTTYAALLANGTFNDGSINPRQWIYHKGYPSIELVINTDQVSANNGVIIEYSERGDSSAVVRTRRLETFDANDVAAGSKKIIIEPHLSFLNISYTNGGVNQGSMFMETRLHAQARDLPRGSLASMISSNNTALMTRGVNFGQSPVDSVWRNITTTQPDASGRVGQHVALMEVDVAVPIQKYDDNPSGSSSSVGTSAVQVATSLPSDVKAIQFQADPGNAKNISLGNNSGVTAGNNMVTLTAGVAQTFPVGNTAPFWVIAGGAGNQLNITYIRRASP